LPGIGLETEVTHHINSGRTTGGGHGKLLSEGRRQKAEGRRQKLKARPPERCLLPTAFCLLLSAFCFLPSAFYSSSSGVAGGYFLRNGPSHSSRSGGTSSAGIVGGSCWPGNSQ